MIRRLEDQLARTVDFRVVTFRELQGLEIDISREIIPCRFRQGRQCPIPVQRIFEQRIPEQLHPVRLYRIAGTKILNAICVVYGNHDRVIKEKAGNRRPFFRGSAIRLLDHFLRGFDQRLPKFLSIGRG